MRMRAFMVLMLVTLPVACGCRKAREVPLGENEPELLDFMPFTEPNEPEVITDSAGIRLVAIPSGEFLMGGEQPAERLIAAFPAALYGKDASYFSDEYPRHRVRITRPFYLGQFEVTVGQFRRFVEETGYKTEAERDGTGGWGYNPQKRKVEGRDRRYNWRAPGFPQTDDHPVVNVSYNDALKFCEWLSEKEKRRYRLPTEAEWEYASRASTSTRYHNGDDPKRLREVAHVLDVKGLEKYGHVHQLPLPPSGPFTVRVGGSRPNAWGLYDMHGNAWEWCSDYYDEDYYARSPADDPAGPAEGTVRVRRGGAWNSFPLYARASFRNYNNADSRCVNLGFRVVREVGR
jgi:formylglycine-generating enzyme required for sulfatase activity